MHLAADKNMLWIPALYNTDTILLLTMKVKKVEWIARLDVIQIYKS
jgi:hypothetical protein